jgi:diguanylate cyclase (GGDEF)-like protein/PAS domain S-box-containing protein
MDILEELEKRVGLIVPNADLQPTMVGYKDILDNLEVGIYAVDRQRKIIYWNRGAEIISGYKQAEVLGGSCSDNILIHVDDQGKNLCQGPCPLAESMADGRSRQARVFLHYKEGHRVPVTVFTSPIRENGGNIVGGIEIFTDLSSPMAAVQRLKDGQATAHFDPISGLVTRQFLDVFINSRLIELQNFGLSFGIAVTSIDHFENIEALGDPEVGDQVIHMVAQTLVKNARSFDLVGREDEREFTIVLPNQTPESLQQHAEKLCHLVRQSICQHRSGDLQVTVSMGVTVARKDDTPESLRGRAQNLLTQSVAAGGNQVTVG